MSIYIPPTLEDIKDSIIANLESRTNQYVPVYIRSFKRVLGNTLAMAVYPIYKFGDWCRKQAFWYTASEDELNNIHGPNEGISRGGPLKLQAVCSVVVSENATISITTSIQNKDTGLYYYPIIQKSVTEEDNTFTIIAEGYGTEYELNEGDELYIHGQIDGIGELATVDSISVYPEDKEILSSYKRRIGLARSGSIGGATAYDYRSICESVIGVKRAFPFSGRPDDPENSLPGDRSIFIESKDEYGTDGIASEELLDTVKSSILINPNTGMSNEQLGNIESTLYVPSISHLVFDMEIYGLLCETSIQNKLKGSILTSYQKYLKEEIVPYVYGLDFEWDRKDNISTVTISEVINGILRQYSATASKIIIRLDDIEIDNRRLIGGEMARAGSISYI
jgi:hypothetical protein